MPDTLKQLLLQLVLILLNAFFAAAEIALISVNEKKVRALAEDGDKKAKKMLRIIEEPTKFLSTIQVGITLAGFLGSAFAADSFAEKLTWAIISLFNVSEVYVETIDTVSVILITVALSYFTLVLGELVPKRIAMRHKEKLANGVCGFISVLTFILKPIIWFLTVSTNLVLRLFGIDPHAKDESVSEEEIVVMLDAGADEGTLKQDDVEYIKNVFKLERLSAADVMTPRSALIAVSDGIEEKELLSIIENEGYSRIPVYSEDLDKVLGVLHTRNYLLKRTEPDFKLADVLLAPEFVPETIHLDALFKKMQESHTHIVLVVNEYGHVSGIVTMEDIIEELVGEIWDEQDEAIESIVPLTEDTYRVLSSVSIDEFFEYFSLEKSEEIESITVNGWLSEVCGNIPEVGFSFEYENLSISVTEADEQMTHEISVVVISVEEDDQDREDSEPAEEK
ncbi:MAG: HlyC/CorC family transporter [Clostridia bacterium]|nr:HlyC/CorC family transporter [Clostridia bacterium]